MAENGNIISFDEALDARNEVYDGEPTLAIPETLTLLLDALEAIGGMGYELACSYQNLLIAGYPAEAATIEITKSAENALRQLGAA